MKVFISWSGDRSRAVAEVISDWIKCVLQASNPWISTRDIDRGSTWFSEISEQLSGTSVGIVCLTQENKSNPWILFEAGALAKGLPTNRVCTFLIDLQTADLRDPLAQFNHTLPTRPSMLQLVITLNRSLKENRLEDKILTQVFETYWPHFEANFQNALIANPPANEVPPRAESDILAEILDNTRNLNQRVRDIELRAPDSRAPESAKSSAIKELLDQLSKLRESSIEIDATNEWKRRFLSEKRDSDLDDL